MRGPALRMNKKLFDIRKATECLTDSFIDYPVFKYLFPDTITRKGKLSKVIAFLIKLGLKKGEILSFPSCEECVSIGYFPHHKNITLIDAIQAGIIQLMMTLGISDFSRFMKLKKHKNIVRNRLLNINNCYFLDMIGVNPVYQKKGLASSLLGNKLKALQSDGIKCYLETSNKENIEFYDKFGFKTINEYLYDGLSIFCLLKD